MQLMDVQSAGELANCLADNSIAWNCLLRIWQRCSSQGTLITKEQLWQLATPLVDNQSALIAKLAYLEGKRLLQSPPKLSKWLSCYLGLELFCDSPILEAVDRHLAWPDEIEQWKAAQVGTVDDCCRLQDRCQAIRLPPLEIVGLFSSPIKRMPVEWQYVVE